jgi:hypothetical protein
MIPCFQILACPETCLPALLRVMASCSYPSTPSACSEMLVRSLLEAAARTLGTRYKSVAKAQVDTFLPKCRLQRRRSTRFFLKMPCHSQAFSASLDTSLGSERCLLERAQRGALAVANWCAHRMAALEHASGAADGSSGARGCGDRSAMCIFVGEGGPYASPRRFRIDQHNRLGIFPCIH